MCRFPVAESLEPRVLFSDVATPTVSVTARRAAAYEDGPVTRFFYIRRSGDVANPLTVTYAVGGKAKQGIDYNAIGSAVTIKPGSWLRRIEITPIDDQLVEPTEAVTLTLATSQAYKLDPLATFASTRIIDNDTVILPPPPVLPTIMISAPAQAASEAGPTARSFTISRGGDLSSPLIVHFTTGGSATAGADFQTLTGSAVIAAGDASVDVSVMPIDDSSVEGNETVLLTLASDAAYSIGSASSASITIADNDVAPQPVGTLSWHSIAPVPLGRSEAMGAVVNGKAYVLGGFHDYTTVPTDEMDRYDPATNTWTRVANIPVPLSHAGVAVDGNYIYVAGGYPANANRTAQLYGTNIVRRYNTVTDTWDTIRSLPEKRATGALVRVGRELHWIAGADINRADRAEHWALNLDDPNAQWVSRAPIPTARNHCGHIVLNGKIYIIGGAILQDAAETPLASMEIYDPASDSWSTGPSMPVARALLQSAVAVSHGRIYVAGGETAFERPTDQVTEYDPIANRWRTVTSLPGKRLAPILLTLDDDHLLCATGYYNQFNSIAWVGTFV